MRLHQLDQEFFYLSIEDFRLTICLRMIRCKDIMCNLIFLKQASNDPIAKMTPKSAQNISFQKICYSFCIIQLGCLCLYPSKYIIRCNQNVTVSSRIRKWTHEVYSPHTKNLIEDQIFPWHLIPFRDISSNFLTSFSLVHKSLCILENCYPEEATILNFSSNSLCITMSSYCKVMVELQYTHYLIIRHTSYHQLITKTPRREWIIPDIIFHI